ncbi:outer membrane beta-barrel family protein [Pedobacter metabolipauper]|uniref:Outer membrane receptor protein involved in Fe transport n=1 Tax=Pedobacter metabolipauper TaxID=425513 RepID=A0A4R6T1I5_9SPHI|nr:outer membrane beta-barrel family protein [Pedobacter metabolipauper]TDQ11498.1 outer membrane receptor protein involved in Fe transport [Pedobacter metabolipauper]
MERKLLLTFITFLSCTYAAIAQTAASTYSIKGSLIDSVSKNPAAFVTIAVKTPDKQVIKTQLSQKDGTFKVDQLPAGKFILSLLSVEYNTKTLEITLGEKETLDLGMITISPANTQLKGVSVTAARPLIKQEADRIAYDLQADPDSKSSSVLEMMRKVPLISVDADDNIQLSGNTAYKIFINGKPSSLMERSPKDVLKSMPASSIQKIEVITTPSSKYDAEGLAGIINIITNKAIENGYSGNVTLSERYPLGGPSLGGSFTIKSGKFGVSAFGGASFANTPTTGITISRISTDAVPSNLFQSADRESDTRNAYLGTELSYEIDSLNLLSAQINLNGSNGAGEFFQHSLLQSNAVILQQYDLLTNNDNSGKGADAALNYQRGFRRNKSQLFTASYRYYGFNNEDITGQLFTNRNNYSLPDFRQVNESVMSEHTVQLDYVYPVKKLSIEAGIKGIFRTNESDFKYFSRDTEDNYAIDPAKTNTFNNTQTILAAYNTYQYNWKSWSVKGGIRLENTAVDADFITTASSVNQHYLSVVPAVTLSRQFKTSSINIGWNQRIQRPGINQLNPFVDRTNPIFENTGNPDLRPTKGNQIRMGYNLTNKGNLNVSLMYNWIRGLIFQVSDFDPATNITRTRYENTGGAKALGGNVNFNYPLTQKWNLSINGNLMHGWADGISGGQPISNKGFMFNCNLSTGLRLPKDWRISGSAYLNGGDLTVQQKTNAFVSTAFNVNKDIIKDKLSFSAFTNNPFSRYRVNVTDRFGPNFNQVNHSQQNFRTMGGSLSYKFGKLKDAIKKNKRGINNDDVSN